MERFKYKPYDRVVVRSDLELNRRYNMEHDICQWWAASQEMVELAGHVVTIRDYADFLDDAYFIFAPDGFPEDSLISSCCWTDEMFEGLESDMFVQPDVHEENLLDLLGG